MLLLTREIIHRQVLISSSSGFCFLHTAVALLISRKLYVLYRDVRLFLHQCGVAYVSLAWCLEYKHVQVYSSFACVLAPDAFKCSCLSASLVTVLLVLNAIGWLSSVM